jgi:hypothetical protein
MDIGSEETSALSHLFPRITAFIWAAFYFSSETKFKQPMTKHANREQACQRLEEKQTGTF